MKSARLCGVLFLLTSFAVVHADPNPANPHPDSDYDLVYRNISFTYIPSSTPPISGFEVTALRHFVDDGDNDNRAWSAIRWKFDSPMDQVPNRPYIHFGSFRAFHGEVYDRTREFNCIVVFDAIIEYVKSPSTDPTQGFIPPGDRVINRLQLRNMTWNSLTTTQSQKGNATVWKFVKSSVQTSPQVVFTFTAVNHDAPNDDPTLHRLRPHSFKTELEIINYPFSTTVNSSLAVRYLVVSRHRHTWHDTPDASATGEHDPLHDEGVQIDHTTDINHRKYFTWPNTYDDFVDAGVKWPIKHYHYDWAVGTTEPDTGATLQTSDVQSDGDELQAGAGSYLATIVWASFHGTRFPHIHWDPTSADTVQIAEGATSVNSPSSSSAVDAIAPLSMLLLFMLIAALLSV